MKRIVAIALAALALAFVFSTCKVSTTSVDDCIDSFMSDISSADRSGVYKNLDDTAYAYNQAKSASYWEFFFPVAEVPYTLSNKTAAGDNVYGTITSSGSVFSSKSIVFVMSEDSDGNAVIRSIAFTSPVGTVFN